LEGLLPAVKCPNCGFVSYTGVDQCKKCNYPFVKSEPQDSSNILTSLFSDELNEKAPLPVTLDLETSPKDTIRPELELPSVEQTASALKSEPAPPLQIFPAKTLGDDVRSKPSEVRANWREELSDRVVNFRKRRGQMPPETTTAGNLELEFEDASKPVDSHFISPPDEATESADSRFDADLEKHTYSLQEDSLAHEKQPFQELDDEMHLDTSSEETEDMSLGEHFEKSHPMEILVGPPGGYSHDEDVEATGLYYAPLNRRVMAGFADALILAAGAGLFAGIFWYTMTHFCDHTTLVPLSMAVLGVVALIVVFSYLSVFTALTSATPGLRWMGCEIRNLQGEHPTVNESLWRAFGVLVSLSALMVGFIWAYVDSESMTWHDHMSGTIITETGTVSDIGSESAGI
jgi:uncharacterized RDD family membrane protein YckC